MRTTARRGGGSSRERDRKTKIHPQSGNTTENKKKKMGGLLYTPSVWLLFYRSRWILLPRRWEFYVLQYLRKNSEKRQSRRRYPGLRGTESALELFSSFSLSAFSCLPRLWKFKCKHRSVVSSIYIRVLCTHKLYTQYIHAFISCLCSRFLFPLFRTYTYIAPTETHRIGIIWRVHTNGFV